MEKPLVTVMMSAYNHEKYVAEAIDSVLNQTYSNFEFLICDDGSQDKTAEIIGAYNDQRIKFVPFKQNTGFKTWDYMLDRTRGEYIACLGSDDVWRADKLEKQVDFLQSNCQYDACFSWVETIDGASNVIPPNKGSRNAYFNVENKSREEWMEHFFFIGSGFAAPTFMMRGDVYKELNGFMFKYRQIQDYDLWIRYMLKHDLYIIPEQLLYYRWHVEDAVVNISAPTRETFTRTSNELEYMYSELIEKFDDDFFIRVFHKYFKNKECHTTEQVMCEKFFLLLNHTKAEAQQCAISYYLKHIDDKLFKECLENEYGFSRVDFHKVEAEKGITWRMYNSESLIEEYQVLLNRAVECIESINATK